MARVDPREHALIGAAWYAGYLARFAAGGMEGVTLAAAAGPSGIIDADGERVHPSYHVIRGHTALAGGLVMATRSSAPRDVQALAVQAGTDLHLWLTNLTGESQDVRLEGVAPGATVRLLDEASVEALGGDPERAGDKGRPMVGSSIVLPPYAVASLRASLA